MLVLITLTSNAQGALKRVYDESIDPMAQIDGALAKARAEGKFVVCQVGGNWCPWCLRFADFVAKDTVVGKLVAEHFEYIHVNYNPRQSAGAEAQQKARQLMARLNHPQRFGFPVFVVLDGQGHVLHIQDSSFLEQGEGYDEDKVVRFFKNWTPEAVNANDKSTK